jgi:hypothetical protein
VTTVPPAVKFDIEVMTELAAAVTALTNEACHASSPFRAAWLPNG